MTTRHELTPEELTILRAMLANETDRYCGALLVDEIPLEIRRSLSGRRFIAHFCAWKGTQMIAPCFYITQEGKAAVAEVETEVPVEVTV